ncbi:MAG TPA: glycoside hydrolase family 32 protein [Chthoniobacterales bacterium]
MKATSLLWLSATALAVCAQAQSPSSAPAAQVQYPLYNEPYRPQYHFSPPTHFMNDPNGLVYFNGWQLYYQYNPIELVAGHQAWGHAVSTDLLHWTNLPIAIPEKPTGQIFTGSAVVDSENTSGFFDGIPGGGLVAVYTLNEPTNEVQNVAYSLNGGITYTDYAGNPVLDRHDPNFRDPKVFWHAPTHRWIMTVALPNAHQVLFYASSDLKNWRGLSRFGPAGIEGLQWECPNLLQVPIEGTNQKKWVLVVGINPGAPQGGSMDEYFVGEFDGTTFRAGDTVGRLMDFGKDFYAAQTYNNTPTGEAVVVGWVGNWQYAQVVPTSPWRSVFSIPRVLSLRQKETQTGALLIQTPVSLEGLHDQTLYDGSTQISTSPLSIPLQGNASFEFETTVASTSIPHQQQQRLNIDILNGAGEKVTVGYDWSRSQVFVDRGQTYGFSNPFFTSDFSTWADNTDPKTKVNAIRLHVLVDRSMLEVFVDNGIQVCTSVFYMQHGPPTEMSWHAENGNVTVQDLRAYSLKSVWR